MSLLVVLTVAVFLPQNSYGDMPAHNLLWRECEKSSDNVAARLAAIPLVQVINLQSQMIYEMQIKSLCRKNYP